MAEYTKLNSEDSGTFGITNFLNENIPFGKKPFSTTKFKNSLDSDKIELIDFPGLNTENNFYEEKIFTAVHRQGSLFYVKSAQSRYFVHEPYQLNRP